MASTLEAVLVRSTRYMPDLLILMCAQTIFYASTSNSSNSGSNSTEKQVQQQQQEQQRTTKQGEAAAAAAASAATRAGSSSDNKTRRSSSRGTPSTVRTEETCWNPKKTRIKRHVGTDKTWTRHPGKNEPKSIRKNVFHPRVGRRTPPRGGGDRVPLSGGGVESSVCLTVWR